MDYKKAFTQTNFIVDDAALSKNLIVINIDFPHPELDNLIENKDWCFITAWNPSPSTFTRIINNERNIQLEKSIQAMNLFYYNGYGQSKNNDWKEDSFLIVDCTKAKAIQLGKEFEQMAIVFGSHLAKAELIILS